MSILKRSIALFSIFALLITVTPQALTGKVANAASPGNFFFIANNGGDDPLVNMASLLLETPNVTIPNDASTTYVLKDGAGTTLDTVTVADTWMDGETQMSAVLDDSKDAPGEEWLIVFDAQYDLGTAGYKIDVNWEGDTPATGNYIYSWEGVAATFSEISMPYVFELGSDPSFDANQVGVFSPFAIDPTSFTYNTDWALSDSSDISEVLLGWAPKSVHVLTFGAEKTFVENDTLNIGGIGNLTVNSLAAFQSVVGTVNTELGGGGGGGGGGCSGFCIDNITVNPDVSGNINTAKITFTGGPVSEAEIETVTNYAFNSQTWGEGIVSANAPASCLSGSDYTCVLVVVNGYLDGLQALFVRTGADGIQNTSVSNLQNTAPNSTGRLWNYSTDSTPQSNRVLHVSGWDNAYKSYTNPSSKVLYQGYTNSGMMWVVSNTFSSSSDSKSLYGPNSTNMNPSGTYYSDEARTISAATLSDSGSGTYTMTGAADATLNGVYGNEASYYNSNMYVYFGGTPDSTAMGTESNYTLTIPSGANAGSYTPSSATAYGNKVYLSFATALSRGFNSGTSVLGANTYSLAISNAVTETLSNLSPTIVAGTNGHIYTNPNESLIWYNGQSLSATVTVSVPDNGATEGTPASDTGTYTISRTGATTDALTVNFSMTGTATVATDYGITAGGSPVTTSAQIQAGQQSLNITLTPVDDLSGEGNETAIFTVTSGNGYSVGTPSSAEVTIADNDAILPTVSVSSSGEQAKSVEGAKNGSFTVSRTGATVSPLTVDYVVSGTATNGTDYTTIQNSVTIQAGQSSANIDIGAGTDALTEEAETAIITLSGSANYTIGTASATVVIGDVQSTDTGNPAVTVTAQDSTASEAGSSTGTFRVTRSSGTDKYLIVNFTMAGTASSGSDYSLSNGSSVILMIPGESYVDTTLIPTDDADSEGSEVATMSITAREGYYTLGTPSSANITIEDNEAAPQTVTVSATDSAAAEATPSSATGIFTLSRAQDTTGNLTVNFTMSGTATGAGTDYAMTAGGGPVTTSAVIPDGQSSVQITLTPVDDAGVESSETAILTLGSGAGYTVAASPNDTATVTIADNDTPAVSVSSVSDNAAAESTPSSNTGAYVISRTGATTGDLTVNFAMTGTTTPTGAGVDYALTLNGNPVTVSGTPIVGSAIIPSGQSSATVLLTPADDLIVDLDETAIMTITSGSGYTVATSPNNTATITITDNDPKGPSLTLRGYGPQNGETGVSVNAPIDMFFDSNPATGSVTFPFSNQSQTPPVQITTGGTPIEGQWSSVLESGGYGEYTFYRVAFNGTLLPSTGYTVRILKSYASTGLMQEATALTSSDTYVSFTFTTSATAGNESSSGGQIQPIAWLGYPQPGSNVSYSNIGAINVQFDRQMDATTFASHVYVKKNVGGVLTDPPGTLSLYPTTGTSNTLQVSGYNFSNSNANCSQQNNCSWVVYVTRDVRDTKGTPIAGMPTGNKGEAGPYTANFYTTYSSTVQNQAATLTSTSLDQYRTASGTSGVPLSIVLSASFSSALNISTVTNNNVKVKQGGTPIAGAVSYDSQQNMVKFTPAAALSTNTAYEFSISTSVTNNSATPIAISAVSKTFTTTGSADNVAPRMVYAEANNFGVTMQFSEQLDSTKAVNKSYYTLKTCASGTISSDGTTCTSGSPSTVSLLSVNIAYETYDGTSKVRMDGLTLTSNASFFIQASTSITDLSTNAMDGSNRSKTGFVMDCSKTEGGQCQYDMGGTMTMDQFDMKSMMMSPVRIEPFTTIPGALSKYAIEFTTEDQLANGSLVVISLPQGTNVSGAKRDTASPKTDFNGGGTGTVYFASSDPAYGNATGGGAANDGVGVIAEANKIVVKLAVSGGGSIASGDRISFDLDGIVNTTTANNTGFSVSIQILGSTGLLIRTMQAMPIPISAAGESSLGGRVTNSVSGAGLNGATLYLETQNGLIKTTTANDANGGGQDGEYKFNNLQSNLRGFLHTDMSLTVGGTPYSIAGEEVFITGSVTKNFTLTPDTGGAVLQVTIIANDLASIENLGINDSVHVFRMIMTSSNGGQGKAYTLTRSDITGGTTVHNINISQAGLWNIGVGPAVNNDTTQMPETDWVSDIPSAMVTVTASDVSQGTTLSGVTFTISAITAENGAEVTGKVVDMSSTALADYKIMASRPQNGTFKVGPEPNTNTSADGTFSLKLENGEYEFRAEKGGFPGAYAHVSVRDGNIYTNWSGTESTGSSGNNPFVMRPPVNTSSCYTVSGRVTDGTNAITGAGINAYKSGGAPERPVQTSTNGLGDYTLCVPTGTWTVEAFAPPPANNFIESKTLSVTADLGSQDFAPSGDIGSISGTISVPGTDDDSGITVMAHSASGTSSATTAVNGTYTITGLPYSGQGTSYMLEIMKPGSWSLKEQTVTVNGAETGADFSVPTLRSVTITLSSAVTLETGIEFHDGTNVRNAHITVFPGQTSTTTSIPQDTYYLNMFIPGVQKSSLTITGASYNSTTGVAVVDGTESISITLPSLYTVSGTVTNPASATVNAWVSFFKRGSYEPPVGVPTSSDGTYSIKLAAGTYEVSANTPGAYSSPVVITVAGNSANNNFALASYNRTISGTVSKSGGGTLAFARVSAIKNGGGFSDTQADQNGAYSLNVNNGTWTLNAVAEGYAQGTSQEVVVSGSNQTGKNFTLTALSGNDVLKPPKMGLVNPSSGGMMVDTDARVRLNVPANALGSGTSSAQLTAQETNDVASTSIGAPLGGKGKEFSATDSTGTPITSFSNEVEIELEYLVSEVSAGGITTKDQVEQIANAYWDDTLGNWVTLATTRTYNDAGGDAIALADATSNLSNVTSVTFKSKTTHFTTFAPIIPTGVTPPDAPTGLAVTAGDTQVTLTWNKNTEDDMGSYNIWEAEVTEGVLTTLAQASCVGATCTKVISSLTNGTLYTFQIIAVDTDGNQSAGSSSVSSTPVAAGEDEVVVTPSGGGGIVLSHRTEDVDVDIEITKFILETIAETVDLTKAGKVPANVAVQSLDKQIKMSFTQDTVVIDEDGKSYTKGIPSPIVATSTAKAPTGKVITGDIYEIGIKDKKLFFSKPVNLQIYLPGNADTTAKYLVYYYDDSAKAWTIAEEGGALKKDADGASYMSVDVYHMTKYAIMKDLGTTTPFTDISNHWGKQYIEELYTKGVVSGSTETTFSPDKPVTRAEILKMILVAFKVNVDEVVASSFKDVPADSWFAKYISKAEQLKIVNGYANGTFKPENLVTRAEAVKMFFLGAGMNAKDKTTSPYKDVPVDQWFSKYVLSADSLGVVLGYKGNLFKPNNNVTRAEVAKMLTKMVKLKGLYDSLMHLGK